MAALAVQRAIIRGVLTAESIGGYPSSRDAAAAPRRRRR
jgi:L-aminopeptidase/D-esterase-like protein